METQDIVVRGARVHNLKNVSLELPKNKLICFTGVSGSGKSSLAFDTLYAEGQRRYVTSLSAYARQFLGQMEKPDVDQITGLAPTISIAQKTAGQNPRSTVGTITEIYDCPGRHSALHRLRPTNRCPEPRPDRRPHPRPATQLAPAYPRASGPGAQRRIPRAL